MRDNQLDIFDHPCFFQIGHELGNCGVIKGDPLQLLEVRRGEHPDLPVGQRLEEPARDGGPTISLWLIGGVTLLMVAVSLVFLSALMRWRTQHRVDNAAQTMLGQRGVVKTAVAPLKPGTAQIAGQLWSVSADSAIATGIEVEVVGREGLTLKVKQLAA